MVGRWSFSFSILFLLGPGKFQGRFFFLRCRNCQDLSRCTSTLVECAKPMEVSNLRVFFSRFPPKSWGEESGSQMCMMTPKLGSSFLAILAASWKNLQRSWGGHQSLRDRFVFGLTVSPGTMQAAMFRLSASWRSGKVQAVDAGKMWWLNHVSNVIVFRFPWVFF